MSDRAPQHDNVSPANQDDPSEPTHAWEQDLLRRYPNTDAKEPNKSRDEFRNYDVEQDSHVRQFYKLNHQHQSYSFVQAKRREFLRLDRRKMGIWEALEFLNTLVDDSDPDTDLSQIEHCLQTAEAIRADGHPEWFVLTGLIHDLGKVLCLFGEPQWAVVGDTFPVGCQFSPKIVFAEYFEANEDWQDERYQSANGVYEEGCGLENVTMSWGHDEYLYHVVKDFLPESALAMIRYHSFYPWHREGEYRHLMNEADHEKLRWTTMFNPYDLYSKSDTRPDVDRLRPYYERLIDDHFPATIAW